MDYRIGIDLGGTKIELALLDQQSQIIDRRRVPTPADDYDATVRAVRDLVQAVEEPLKGELAGTLPSVGVGIPGTISPATNLIKNANSTCLIGRALDRDLKDTLGREVRLANDADCFALSEAMDGAGSEASIVFGVILGTGVGGGLVINKSIVRGPNAITGEWGHNPLPWPADDERPGPPCYCGQSGCIETFLSGPGLTRTAQQQSDAWTCAEEIVEAAVAGDSTAQQCLTLYSNRLAKALASIINVIDPEVIVLGGGLSNVTSLYRDVPALWDAFVFSDTVVTKLVPPRHGDSSGVRGAAWLWPAAG